MLAYILLICALSGSQRTLALGNTKCRVQGAQDELKILHKQFPDESTHKTFFAKHNQGEFVDFEVPKDERNCNLTCFLDGVMKYSGKTSDNPLKSFVNNFQLRANRCKAISCYSSCEEKQNVNASSFWERLSGAFENIKNNLTKSSNA